MYTEVQIAQWCRQANLAKLENRSILKTNTPKELTKIFNGIGSDGFPEWLRIAISKLHPSLMAVALIHDVEWHKREQQTKKKIVISEKDDYIEFRASNKRFDINATKMAKYNYGFFDPRRYIVEGIGWNFARLCNKNIGFKWWRE